MCRRVRGRSDLRLTALLHLQKEKNTSLGYVNKVDPAAEGSSLMNYSEFHKIPPQKVASSHCKAGRKWSERGHCVWSFGDLNERSVNSGKRHAPEGDVT